MKAIVLTCDKYRTLTDHMIFKYEELWPNHPFQFRVPYQDLDPTLDISKVDYKKTPSDIKSTVITLLDDLDDEELIYWCIDDKYPIELIAPKIEKIYQWLTKEQPPGISGILFCRCRKMLVRSYLTGKSITDNLKNTYLERKGYEQIWIHQFIRVKVLRHLFESFPDVIPQAKSMDGYIKETIKPTSHRIFVSKQNYAVFGESTSRGVLTPNCHKSIIENGLTLPEWHSDLTTNSIVMGSLNESYWSPRNLFKRVKRYFT